MKCKMNGDFQKTKKDWEKWYAHKSNKELCIEQQERLLDEKNKFMCNEKTTMKILVGIIILTAAFWSAVIYMLIKILSVLTVI